MNRLFLAVGLLSAGVAFGQNQTTGTSSTTTSTSNYNSSNTNNENSRNATMGTGSNSRPMSTTGTPTNRNSGNGMGTSTSGTSTGSYSTSSTTGGKSYNSNRIGTDASGVSTDSYSSSSTTGNSGSYNSGSMATDTSTMTPRTSGSYNGNSMGTGTSTITTPSTTGSYNSGTTNSSSTVTTNSSYSTPAEVARPAKTKDYKNFAYGIYAGLNSTRFRGESIDTDNPAGRVGYQAGFFVRGGGRLFGQIGAEYFASSSNYFRPGDGQKVAAIRDQINVQYVQIPVYIGYKLTESDRGISAVRVQAGIEYANRINSSSGQFNLSNSEIKSGSFNALGQLGFDIGPFLIDLTYHHGLSNAVQINTFQGSSRRIASASIGFKF